MIDPTAVPPNEDQLNAEAGQIVELLGGILDTQKVPPVLKPFAAPLALIAVRALLQIPNAQARLEKLRNLLELRRQIHAAIAD